MAKKKVVKDAEVKEEKVKASKAKKKEIEKIEEVEEVEEFVEETDFEEESNKEKKNKKEKKAKKDKKDGYVKSVNKELKKVVWPSVKDVAKYTLAVIIFCLILCAFFYAMELLSAFVKGLFV